MGQSDQKPDHPAPQAPHHELRTAENSAAYLLVKLQAIKENSPHLTLLDVGAGSGSISATLAKAIPEGKVTAIDLKEDILLRARTVAELAGVKNIEFQQADVYKLPFADETFDVTHCHQVLCHLKHPSDALRDMLRVTKPGGVVAAREGDYETDCVWPQLPGLDKFHKCVAGLMTRGGSAIAGRQLLPWALKAGAGRDQVTLSYGTWWFDKQDDKGVWGRSPLHTPKLMILCLTIAISAEAMIQEVRDGMIRKAGLQLKLATETDMEEMAQAWQEWAEAEDSSLALMHGEILIQK